MSNNNNRYERTEISNELDEYLAEIVDIGLEEAEDVYEVEKRELTTTIYIVVDGPFDDLLVGLIVRKRGNEYTVAPGMISNDMEFWTTQRVESVYRNPAKAVEEVHNRVAN